MDEPSGAQELLIYGIAAAKAGHLDEARYYLRRVLRLQARPEQRAKALLWLAQVEDNPQAQRDFLEEACLLDPANYAIQRRLAVLKGQLAPDEVFDPEHPPAPEPPEAASQPLQMRRFVCPQCGGKMTFRAGGKTLSCRYCGYEMSLLKALQAGAMVQEQNFVVGMATAKGHVHPTGVRPFVCQGCGATFMVGQGTLSLTCPYCGTPHVAQQETAQQLVLPEAVVPFALSREEIRRKFFRWFDRAGLRGRVWRIRGLYLPAWTFDLGGEIGWSCYVESNNGMGRTERGLHLVYEDDILVPASHTLPGNLLLDAVTHFSTKEAIPYKEEFLVNWPAEVYDVSMSDASLVARRIALERAREFMRVRLRVLFGDPQNVQLNTGGLIIESFKLLLLPAWITRYRAQGKIYHVLIDGQSGEVHAQEPGNWLQRLWRRFQAG